MNRRNFFGRLVGGVAALCDIRVPPAPIKASISPLHTITCDMTLSPETLAMLRRQWAEAMQRGCYAANEIRAMNDIFVVTRGA